MASKRLTRVTGYSERPGDTWCYECDGESDVTAALPAECVLAIVAAPGSGKSPVRIRKTNGAWAEVG